MGIYDWLDALLKAKLRYVRKTILFQTICDGFTELEPIMIEGRAETDETECQQWQCNNIYTQCDGVWNCLDGTDEIGCDIYSPLNCSSDHLCVSPQTNQLMCLSIKNANDGKIDCLGATDEPKLCRAKYVSNYLDNFYCGNITLRPCIRSKELCDGKYSCYYLDSDEQFCEKNRTFPVVGSICQPSYLSLASDAEKFLCNYTMNGGDKQQIVYFSLDGVSQSLENNVIPSKPIITEVYRHPYRCNRGLDLYVWMGDGNLKSICFCPPSFYGDRCQYQNQRVSLTLQFRVSSDSWKTLFATIVSLIDDSNQRIIHSYEQFSYLSIRDCTVKFQIYLVYSIRLDPKIQQKIMQYILIFMKKLH